MTVESRLHHFIQGLIRPEVASRQRHEDLVSEVAERSGATRVLASIALSIRKSEMDDITSGAYFRELTRRMYSRWPESQRAHFDEALAVARELKPGDANTEHRF